MIELPHDIGPAAARLSLLDFGGVMRPDSGGAVTRVNRGGTRFAADVQLPPLVHDDRGRLFVARLVRAVSEGLRIEVPLGVGHQGSPGQSITLSADVAGGTSIAITGANPGYSVREGYWLSLVKSGQHYLHQASAQVTVGGGGTVTLSIWPPLRTDFSTGDAVHLARPMMEGLVVDDGMAWELSLAHHVGLSFRLEESA